LPKAVTIVSAGTASDNREYRLAIQPSKILHPFEETKICAVLHISNFIQARSCRSLLLYPRKIAKSRDAITLIALLSACRI